MATNPNETGSYEVIHKTNWSKGNKIERKTRLVVIRFRDTEKPMRYAVRWQYERGDNRGDNGPTFGGAAYGLKESAHDAFMRKYLEHNGDFKAGNPSHLPGIVK